MKELRLQSDLPVAFQLKEQIKGQIAYGGLKSGEKLPTAVELAGYLGINRNTVVAAYQDLEAARLLESVPGRGTFVAESQEVKREMAKRVLAEIVEEALEQAGKLGYGAREVASIALAIGDRSPQGQAPRLLFVECNEPDLKGYQAELEQELKLPVEPVLLTDLPARARKGEVVLTTVSHLAEVKEIVGPEREVLALGFGPTMNFLMEVSGLPAGTTIGVTCQDPNACRDDLLAAGINHLEVLTARGDSPEELQALFSRVQRVYATRLVLDQVRPLAPSGVEVREFPYVLDHSSLRMVRDYLAQRSQRA
ncbi:MAG: GntR family transcriptional regulator [Deinococcus sp.]|nr:GntR family transcriptional regulator [Deinococcus sp.]